MSRGSRPLRIAMIGTRGVPAAYGGFETAVEEIGRRLVARGHEVTVYCRRDGERPRSHLGMRLVHLPALRLKVAETLTHTALSALHASTRPRAADVAFVFNAANSPFLPLLGLRRIPTALHMDGLEWKRAKWGRAGRRYYQLAEWLGVRLSGSLIADAHGIADYYRDRYAATTELLTYGAPIADSPASDRIAELELAPRAYHLVVARFEPENHVAEIVEGFARSTARRSLVVVGSAPYSARYTQRIRAIAEADPRIHLLGGIWDQELLDQLYGNAASYLHGHSVGGTNPSLLRAMGAGAPVIAFDVDFNREVLGDTGAYFADPDALAALLGSFEADQRSQIERGAAGRERARARYDWDDVADGYEDLAQRLVARRVARPRSAALPRRTAPREVSL